MTEGQPNYYREGDPTKITPKYRPRGKFTANQPEVQGFDIAAQYPVGTQEFTVDNGPHGVSNMAFRLAAQRIDSGTAAMISAKMRSNSAVSYQDQLGADRPKSAFYSLVTQKDENTGKETQTLKVEFGDINDDGKATDHAELRKALKIEARTVEGTVIRSGHIGEVKIPTTALGPVKVALFDSLAKGFPVAPGQPEYTMVQTLITHKVLPLTSDGYPVELMKQSHFPKQGAVFAAE